MKVRFAREIHQVKKTAFWKSIGYLILTTKKKKLTMIMQTKTYYLKMIVKLKVNCIIHIYSFINCSLLN